jgi:lipopolysaccharide export system protein LptA
MASKQIFSILGTLCLLTLTGADPGRAQNERALIIKADSQEANSNTGIIIAKGNVSITYPLEEVTARSQKATYYVQEQRILLEGNVTITQRENKLQAEKVTYLLTDGTIQADPAGGQQVESIYILPTAATPTP